MVFLLDMVLWSCLSFVVLFFVIGGIVTLIENWKQYKRDILIIGGLTLSSLCFGYLLTTHQPIFHKPEPMPLEAVECK